jgi:hypothetical protein
MIRLLKIVRSTLWLAMLPAGLTFLMWQWIDEALRQDIEARERR